MKEKRSAGPFGGLLNDWPLWLGYGLFWNWLWFLFVKPLGATMGTPGSAVLLDDRSIIVAAALATFAIAWLLRGRINVITQTATAAFAIATIASFIPNIPSAFMQPIASICSGALAALLFASWSPRIAQYDSRRVIRIASLALAAASLGAIVIFLLDASKQDMLLALVPLGSAALLLTLPRRSEEGKTLGSKSTKKRPRGREEEGAGNSDTRNLATRDADAKDAHGKAGGEGAFRAMPWRLLCTVFLQGAAIGLWHFIFQSVTIVKCSARFCIWREMANVFSTLGFLDFVGFSSILGFLLALALLLLTAYFLHLNYRRLIYQIGIPFMALAFIVISFNGGIIQNGTQMTGDLFVIGEILYTAGYFYVFAIVQTLCSHLVSDRRPQEAVFFSAVGFLLLAGQAVGYLSGMGANALGVNGTDMCMLAVFVLMMCGLILIKGNPIWEDLGDAKPAATSFSKGAFRLACDEVATEAKLTPRETEVFMLLAHGRNLGFVQEQLVISRDTAKSHLRNIYRKLDVHAQQELMSIVDARADELRAANRTKG